MAMLTVDYSTAYGVSLEKPTYSFKPNVGSQDEEEKVLFVHVRQRK